MDDLYGGTIRYFNRVASTFDLSFTYVDLSDPSRLKAAITPKTKVCLPFAQPASLKKLTELFLRLDGLD